MLLATNQKSDRREPYICQLILSNALVIFAIAAHATGFQKVGMILHKIAIAFHVVAYFGLVSL